MQRMAWEQCGDFLSHQKRTELRPSATVLNYKNSRKAEELHGGNFISNRDLL
jgi:hypothetical protein